MLWLAASSLPADAQGPIFLDAVRELAATAAPDAAAAADSLSRRAAALARMNAALDEWNRTIGALEQRVARELRNASDERRFQLHVELGIAYRLRGRFDDALREFDAAASVQPRASDVHVLRALTLEAAGRDDEAADAYRIAWLRAPSDPAKAYLFLSRARSGEEAEHDRARTALTEVLTRPTARREPDAAPVPVLDAVPDGLSRTPIAGDRVLAPVFAHLARNRLDDALAAAGDAGANDTSATPFTELQRGRSHELEGRYAEARTAYAAALAGTLTGRHMLYVGIGRLAQVDGDIDAAVDAFERAARLSPNDPVLHRELAAAYAAAGRTDAALTELAAALLIDPRDVDAMVASAQLLLDDEHAADAVNVLRRAIDVNPDRVDAHYALAVALSRAGRPDEAARQFERVDRLGREELDERRRTVTGKAGPEEDRRR